MHTHPRIREYVMVGANLPPPESNRVKLRQPKCKSKFRNQNQSNSIVFHRALAFAESDLTLPVKKAATPDKREVIAVANSQSTFLYLYPRAPFPSSQPKQLLLF